VSRRLLEIVSAANRGDARAHFLELVTWARDVPLPSQQRAGGYLLYPLWRRVKVFLGRRPSPEDLHELTGTTYPRFSEIVRANEVQLEETFRRVFEFPPRLAAPTPGEFAVFSSVALGVLLASPQEELEAMRPGPASWLRRNQEQFRAEGLLDDETGAKRPLPWAAASDRRMAAVFRSSSRLGSDAGSRGSADALCETLIRR
jgi:hypothetical protein